MITKHPTATLTIVAGALLLAGCGTTTIAYKPMAAAAPAATSNVALSVVDARPADKGGSDKAQVGQIRGSYGIPSGVSDSSADVAVRTVTDATTDALRHAGVGTQGGSKKLVATLKHYWMDGMMGYKATVWVEYSLQDGGGKVLWTGEAKGGAGGTNMFRSPNSFTQDMFEKALADYATKATEVFKSPAFKAALAS